MKDKHERSISWRSSPGRRQSRDAIFHNIAQYFGLIENHHQEINMYQSLQDLNIANGTKAYLKVL